MKKAERATKEKTKPLWNLLSKNEAMAALRDEGFDRITLSFYRYVIVHDVPALRDALFREWTALGVLGRIYLAEEGINAQLNVPEHNFDAFVDNLNSRAAFKDMPLKIAVEQDNFSFYKLTLKAKRQIVADGLESGDYDVTDVGTHLTALEFNAAMEDPDAIVVDMRNGYESEVGRFENALCPKAETFKEELQMVPEMLADKKDKKILLYCTGGIRCEKASAYLKHRGFRDVNQLYGGVIRYAHDVKAANAPSKFKGKNFVFDGRMGERITDDVLGSCYQCGAASDAQSNCANEACHALIIQCAACKETHRGACSAGCAAVLDLPEGERARHRKENGRAAHHRNGLSSFVNAGRT